MSFIFDGKSRPTNDKYRSNWNDIFKKLKKITITNKCQKCKQVFKSNICTAFCGKCWDR